MLQLVGLSKTLGHRVLFDRISLSAHSTERIGLVGPAGCGKTTLLRMILGLEGYTEGRICIPPCTWFGYLPQLPVPVGDYTFEDVMATAREDCLILRSRFDGSAPGFRSARSTPRQIQAALAEVLELGEVSSRTRIASLELQEQNRIWLASLLLAHPDVLVIDDPVATLSPSLAERLDECLDGYAGLTLIASPDRAALQGVVDTFWEVLPDRNAVEAYPAENNRRLGRSRRTLGPPRTSRFSRASAG